MVPQSSSREAQEQIQVAKHRAERPKIQQQFADLKRGLSAVTDEEWDSIPEVGNLTRKKRRRAEKTFVIPDSVLVGDRSKNEYENLWFRNLHGSQRLPHLSQHCHSQIRCRNRRHQKRTYALRLAHQVESKTLNCI